MPKSKFCFYCSCVRMKNYETPSIFMDIVIDEHDFEEQLCLMAPCCIDLDITEERLNYPKPPLDDKQCDYYEEFDMPIDLLLAFTSVLVRMYVNYVLNCLFELDLTLVDQKKLIELVSKHGCGLMYDFFWETNYRFAYDFLENFPGVSYRTLLWYF